MILTSLKGNKMNLIPNYREAKQLETVEKDPQRRIFLLLFRINKACNTFPAVPFAS